MSISKLQPPEVLVWSNFLAERLVELPKPIRGIYYVRAAGDDFTITCEKKQGEKDKILFKLTENQIVNGLTSREWDCLGLILSETLKGQPPCQKQ